MRRTMSLIAVCVGLTAATTAGAQGVAMPDSAMRAAMMNAAMKQNQPADYVLEHRADLALSAEQVTKLEALVRALRDSAGVRQARSLADARTRTPSPVMMAMAAWSGPIDEKALRDALCQQSANSVEYALRMAYDRRAVGALLTPEQLAMLPELQAADMMKAMKR